MTFFARPNLDNTQFKQLEGSILTLSGQAQIATTSGLTLIGDGGMYIPIIATGASNNFVLTYDNSEQVIKLKQTTSTGAATIYPYSGLTTCTVGGLTASTCIYNCQLYDIIQCMVAPTLAPALTSPSLSSFTITPTTTLYEVGCSVFVAATSVLNYGCINPQYTALCNKRSCGAYYYIYTAFGMVYSSESVIAECGSYTYNFPATPINAGNNIVSGAVVYRDGVQPYYSNGTPYSTPLAAGQTSTCSRTICGTYPWYWGIVPSGGAAAGANRPTPTYIKSLITGGTANKCIELSTGTIYNAFNSTSGDYLWFATPVASTTKTCWYIDALNKGTIGGGISAGCNLFPDPVTITDVCSFNGCWTGQSYKVYISNYQSASVAQMEIRNS